MVKNNKLIVKSNYIIEASYKLSLGEQRVIYVLASMIKPTDKEFKVYKLTVKEFAEIVGTKSKDMYAQISKYVDGLRERDLTIVKEKSILKTKWLSSAEYFIDDGFVELCFDPKLKPYLLMLKERFTKLSLEKMVSFKSQHSGRIYELLKQYEKIGERTFMIDELKSLLGMSCDEYTQYGLFKQRILNKAKEEMSFNTDIRFDFKEIKTGRKVTSIKFYIINNNSRKTPFNEIAATSTTDETEENNDDMANITLVKSIIKENISDIEAYKIFIAANEDIEKIKEKYAIISKLSKLNNVVGAMIKALRENWTTTSKSKTDVFNDYEQRTYDFEELEKKLLGWK